MGVARGEMKALNNNSTGNLLLRKISIEGKRLFEVILAVLLVFSFIPMIGTGQSDYTNPFVQNSYASTSEMPEGMAGLPGNAGKDWQGYFSSNNGTDYSQLTRMNYTGVYSTNGNNALDCIYYQTEGEDGDQVHMYVFARVKSNKTHEGFISFKGNQFTALNNASALKCTMNGEFGNGQTSFYIFEFLVDHDVMSPDMVFWTLVEGLVSPGHSINPQKDANPLHIISEELFPDDEDDPEDPDGTGDPDDEDDPEDPDGTGDPDDEDNPEDPNGTGDPDDEDNPEDTNGTGDTDDPVVPNDPADPNLPEDPGMTGQDATIAASGNNQLARSAFKQATVPQFVAAMLIANVAVKAAPQDATPSAKHPVLSALIDPITKITNGKPAGTTFIPDGSIPFSAGSSEGWALYNMILTIATALIMVMFLSRGRREEDPAQHAGKNRVKFISLKYVSVWAAIAAVMMFAITQNMSQPMVMVDKHTLYHLVILVAQATLPIIDKAGTSKKVDNK